MAERAGISLENEHYSGRTSSSGPGKSELTKINEWALQIFCRQYEGVPGQVARQYVQQRGISEASSKDWGLGLAIDSFDSICQQARRAKIDSRLLLAAGLLKEGDHGRIYDTFRNRLMFPIRDVTGRIIGFGGRTLADDPAKYLNTPATVLFDKSSNLFGIDRAKHAASKIGRIIVVEGYTDCIMAHQHGFQETVATLGTAMTESHAGLLKRYCDRVVLVFDSDEAGQNAADRALAVTLVSGLDVTLARVPEGKDPCDYLLAAGGEAFDGVLRNAISALEFKWRLVARQYEAGETGPARRRAVDAFLQQMATWVGRGVVDPIQKGLLVNQLSKTLSLRAEDIHQQLGRLVRNVARTASRTGTRTSSMNRATVSTSAGIAPIVSPSAEELALRQMIEVLLNEPQWYWEVEGYLDPRKIPDGPVARIVHEFREAMSSNEIFRLDEFIGRFESTEFAQLITDLQMAGEKRGEFDKVITGTKARLEECARSRQVADIADEIRRHQGTSPGTSEGECEAGPDSENERLLTLAAHARRSHFSPVSARKKFLQR